MKKLIIGLLLWSFGSTVFAATIFTQGALSYIARNTLEVGTDGGDGVGSASANYDPGLGYNGQSISTIHPGNIAEPITLLAEADSSSSSNFQVDSSAIQRFRYTGSSAVTITARGFFGGTISSSATGSGLISGKVALISAVGSMNYIVDDFNDRTLFNDLPASGNFGGLTTAKSQINLTASGTYADQIRIVTLDVNPNDEFFLLGQVYITDGGGIDVQSSNNRFTLSHSNDLVQVSAVPVPAAVWLMGSAMLGLLGCKRKS